MQSISYALPTINTISKQDQIDLLVVQATGAIVSAYIEHLNVGIQKGLRGFEDINAQGVLNTDEIINLVNSVQVALRTIP